MEQRSISINDEVMPNCLDIGLVDYRDTHRLQLQIHSSVSLDISKETIIITEHFPVYTFGRRKNLEALPKETLIPIIDVERGGGLTFHGPGQIVGYPILNLAHRKLSIPQYLRALEGALGEALLQWNVEAQYKEEHQAGLWVGDKKLVSIGIAVRRFITFHGFALNVDCDLTPFRNARPCGLSGDQVTSLKELGMKVSKEQVKKTVMQKLEETFFK